MKTDICVLGGGMAGTFAALASAKAGAKVLLVEPANVLGGQGTAGGVAGFCGDTALVNDDFRELEKRLVALNAIVPCDPLADRRPYHLEWCAFCLQEMAASRGVEVLLHSRAIAAETKDGRVLAVQIATPGDVVRVEAEQFIDATGQCWLVRHAGLPTDHLGANRQLPMSLYFTLWDTGAPVPAVLPPGCPTWETDDDLPMTTLEPGLGGRLDVKMKVIGFDAADGRDYSGAEQAARRTMAGLIHHLQTKGYGGKRYERHTLASVSRALGVREQHRILGEHLLTEAEVLAGTRFPDAVVVGTYHLDYHWPDRVQRAGTGICTMTEPYHIPLGSMRPRGAVNILVPGRGSAGDQMAMSSFRVMATVIQMGTAAGLAAAQCVARTSEAVDLARLQRDLASIGQELRLAKYGDYLRQHRLTTGTLFAPGSSFPQCHASTLAQLPDGRFVVAFFAGTKEGHADTAIWLTTRDAGQWSPPRRLFKVTGEQHWNPVLFVAPDETLHLWFKVGPDCARWRTWHTVSIDGGETWEHPVRMQDAGPVRNPPIVTTEGLWLAGASDELRADAEGRMWWPFIERSADGGRTWTATPILLEVGAPEGKGGIQPTLWESSPGTVHCLLRTGLGAVYRSDSADGGRTWCRAYRTGLPNNNSGIAVTRLPDGRLVLAWNPVAGDWAARTPLRLSLSSDNGLTWTHHLDLATGPGEFSYPALLPTATGIAATWTDRRTTIGFWHGAVERLLQATTVFALAQATVLAEPVFRTPMPYVIPPAERSGVPFYSHNHCPAITWLPNGDLLACWFSTIREEGAEMTILASRLRAGAERWDAAAEFLKAPNCNMAGSSLFYDEKTGVLHHLNGQGRPGVEGWAELVLVHRVSKDNGVTWTTALPVSAGGRYQRRNHPIPGLLRTRAGLLVQLCDATEKATGNSALHVSRDGGETWEDTGGDIRGIHAGMVELKDGRWLAFGRGNDMDGRMPQSISADLGKTWQYSASEFPGIGSAQRLVLLRLREGPLLLVSYTGPRDASTGMSFGCGVFAALSDDEGQTWSVRKLLTPGEGTFEVGPYFGAKVKRSPVIQTTQTEAEREGYLAATQSPDGLIHLISSRLYYRFNLAWLRK